VKGFGIPSITGKMLHEPEISTGVSLLPVCRAAAEAANKLTLGISASLGEAKTQSLKVHEPKSFWKPDTQ
jgi:hypothetical protein